MACVGALIQGSRRGQVLGEPFVGVQGWARGLAPAEARKAGDQVLPASGLGEVLAMWGGLWLGEGRQGACFPSCGQLGGHTHSLTHSLALSTWVVPASSWGLWACLVEGTASPRASRKWEEGWAPRGRGGDGLLRFQDTGGCGMVLRALGVSVFPIWEVGFVGILG